MTSETSLKYRIAAYRGDEPFAFFSYAHDDSALVFAEFDRKIDHGWPDLKSGKQVVGRADAGFHCRAQHDVRAGKANLRGQARELRPVNTTLQQDAVQGEEHVALVRESSEERGRGEQPGK